MLLLSCLGRYGTVFVLLSAAADADTDAIFLR